MTIRKIFITWLSVFIGLNIFLICAHATQTYFRMRANAENENISFLDSVYDLYRSELIGDLLIGDHDLTSSLLSEIKEKKDIAIIYTGKFNFQIGQINRFGFKKHYKLTYAGQDLGTLTFFKAES